jgi:hypothetical protein
MSGFHDLMEHVERNVFLDNEWFAETVTLRTDAGDEVRTSAHCKYSVREADGEVVETLAASFLQEVLPDGLDHRYRLYRDKDDRAFLWRFNGSETRNRYRATFERRTKKRQGVKP